MESLRGSDPPYSFEAIDATLAVFGFDNAERLNIYKILVGILLLEDILFEIRNTDSSEKCYVAETSRHILNNAALLFRLDAFTLENALVTRSIGIRGSTIKFVFARIILKLLLI